MNYSKIYDSLIERAKMRVLEGYSEDHHIIPKCMGGTDILENLVSLTPEEHFLAHQLLCKMYPCHFGLVRAAMLMTIHHTSGRSANKLYGWLRRKHAVTSSEFMKEWHKHNPHPKGMLGKNKSKDSIDRAVLKLKQTKKENGRRIHRYDLQGNFETTHHYLSDAAKFVDSNPSNILYAANRNGYAYGYYWSWEKLKRIETKMKLIWINDGSNTKRVTSDSEIPNGWKIGMLKRKTSQ